MLIKFIIVILIIVAAYIAGALIFMAVLVVKGLKEGNIKSLSDRKFRSEFRQLLPIVLLFWWAISWILFGHFLFFICSHLDEKTSDKKSAFES